MHQIKLQKSWNSETNNGKRNENENENEKQEKKRKVRKREEYDARQHNHPIYSSSRVQKTIIFYLVSIYIYIFFFLPLNLISIRVSLIFHSSFFYFCVF